MVERILYAMTVNINENPSQSGGTLPLIQKIMCPNQININGQDDIRYEPLAT